MKKNGLNVEYFRYHIAINYDKSSSKCIDLSKKKCDQLSKFVAKERPVRKTSPCNGKLSFGKNKSQGTKSGLVAKKLVHEMWCMGRCIVVTSCP